MIVNAFRIKCGTGCSDRLSARLAVLGSFRFAAGGQRAVAIFKETLVPDTLADLRRDLAEAYRIVANEGVLDAFGHVSMRHPTNPNRYFLSRSRAPGTGGA